MALTEKSEYDKIEEIKVQVCTGKKSELLKLYGENYKTRTFTNVQMAGLLDESDVPL